VLVDPPPPSKAEYTYHQFQKGETNYQSLCFVGGLKSFFKPSNTSFIKAEKSTNLAYTGFHKFAGIYKGASAVVALGILVVPFLVVSGFSMVTKLMLDDKNLDKEPAKVGFYLSSFIALGGKLAAIPTAIILCLGGHGSPTNCYYKAEGLVNQVANDRRSNYLIQIKKDVNNPNSLENPIIQLKPVNERQSPSTNKKKYENFVKTLSQAILPHNVQTVEKFRK
jgi:hypothetical protein